MGVITSTLKQHQACWRSVGRQLTMPLCKLVNEFLRTFLSPKQCHKGSGSLKSMEEGVFYMAIKFPSVGLMGAL